MKTSIKNSALFATALVAGVFAVGNAFTEHFTTNNNVASAIPTVVITAQRMNEEQKIVFDAEEFRMQTVVISARHLTMQEKMTMDRDEQDNAQRLAAATNHRTSI